MRRALRQLFFADTTVPGHFTQHFRKKRWLVLATLAMIGEENAEVDELHRGLLLLLSESRRAAVQDRALRWQPKVPAPAP